MKNINKIPEHIDLLAANKIDIKKFVLVSTQLALLIFVIFKFRVEEEHGILDALLPLGIGFFFHSLLPIKFRLPFFLLLSVVTYGVVIGSLNALILIGLGLVFILIANLKINYWLRVFIITAGFILLILLRTNLISSSWGSAILPIFGSIFMFRMVLYLYEMKQKPLEANLWQHLSYFFLLPNVLFPLFPIVDYKTFLKTYYDTESYSIYQKGLQWMLRGVIQLILYKFVYYYMIPAPSEIIDFKTLLVSIISNYFLLFRISGQSHLIVGMLALFGFNLPMIFNKYFLANGFNDFWRRINIYWKDFVMKIFYYPVFFMFKKIGQTSATVITLLIIFFITWMLHSYQWLWVQGVFPITLVDGLFWGIFGVLIVLNSVIQTKKKKKKSIGSRGWNFSESVKLSSQIVGMFIFMNILWSLWMSSSVSEWLETMSVLKNLQSTEILIFLFGVIAAIIIGALIQLPIGKYLSSKFGKDKSFNKLMIVTMLPLIIIFLVSIQEFYLPKKNKLERLVTILSSNKPNTRDSEIAERGYYEPILKGNTLTTEIGENEAVVPPDWAPLYESEAARETNDLYFIELIPNKTSVFKRAVVTTNSFGMRDKEYSIEKPKNTLRIVLLGTSFEMGSGVESDQMFEKIVEERLNSEFLSDTTKKIEILNFSVGGYHLIQCVKQTKEKIFKFNPDIVLYFAHSQENKRVVDRSTRFFIDDDIDLEYDFLKKIRKEIGYKKGMSRNEAQKKLLSYGEDVVKWGYNEIAKECIKHGAKPIWIFLPTLEGIFNEDHDNIQRIKTIAKNAGFETISLEKVFKDYEKEKLWVAPWDMHPNKQGHQLIADMLYTELTKKLKEINIIF